MQMIKSINSLHSCKFISILVFLIIIYTNRVVAYDEYNEIIQDLPAATDLDRYLSALEKLVNFCRRYKHYVDLNLKIGLIIMDVNLRKVMQEKRRTIPVTSRLRLEKLFLKNHEVTKYFQSMVESHEDDPIIAQNIKLVQLFYNSTTWLKRPDQFNKDLLNQTKFFNSTAMEDVYGDWQTYHDTVDNFEEMKPSPAETDACIALLALNDVPDDLTELSQINCLAPTRCKRVMQGGNEFGYGLSHRIFYMVIARFSRRCVVFSEKQDKSMTDTYCRKCFNEVKYIASNSFQLPDLMFEQIALCGLFGHAQFLRQYWINSPLRFQTAEGCFSEKIATGHFDENQMRDDESDEWKILRHYPIMNGQCNGHFTAMAAGVLSNALRYIIETYY